MTKKDSSPPPKQGTGKPPKPRPNEIDLITLIDDYIEANKNGKNS